MEESDLTVWRIRFVRGYGPVVRRLIDDADCLNDTHSVYVAEYAERQLVRTKFGAH